MPITLGSNIASLSAQRRLADGTNSHSRSLERISSGLRINRASDDAAGLAIALSLKTDTRVFTQAIRNVNDGLSLLTIAEGALVELTGIAVRQRELAEQAANGSYSLEQRRSLNTEANSLVQEFNRIVGSVAFNDRKLLDKSLDGLRIQAGYGLDGSVAFGLAAELARTAGDGTFQAQQTYVSGSTARAVISGDFNGDGLDDIITITESNTVSVLSGNGDGTFKARVTYVSGSWVGAIAAQDLNGDGILDIVTTDNIANRANVLFGNSNGSFKAAVSFVTGLVPLAVTITDVNNDGIQDIVSADSNSFGLSVLLGNGNGTFKARISAISGGFVNTLAVGDLNGDGIADIVGNTGSPSFTTFLGNGDGTFRVQNINGANTSAVSLSDLNGDGWIDIVTVSNVLNSASVYLGNGDGTFKAKGSFMSGGGSESIVSSDFNGDGIMDLVATNSSPGAVTILIGNGDGTFLARRSFSVSGTPGSLAIGDFNRDGVSDLVAVGTSASNASVLMSNTREITSIAALNINTREGALAALKVIDATLGRISSELGAIGSTQSRLGTALDSLAVARENFEAATGRILNADFATESAELIRTGILQQASSAILAQARQQPALVLRLLRED